MNKKFLPLSFVPCPFPFCRKYRLSYQLKTADKENLDTCFLINNGNLITLISSDFAEQIYSKSQKISEELTSEIEIKDGKLTVLILDKTLRSRYY